MMEQAPPTIPDEPGPAESGPVESGPVEPRRLEMAMSRLLITCIAAAGGVIAVGIAAVITTAEGSARADYSSFTPSDVGSRSITSILAAASNLDVHALLMTGLLMVIATPIARVMFSLVSFLRERDRLYTVITSAVLAALCYSLLVGRV